MKEQLKNNLIYKNFGLTENQTKRLINALEEQIIEHKLKLEQYIEPFKELEKLYLSDKARIECIQQELTDDESTLQLLSTIRTGKVQERIIRTSSHLKAKIKKPHATRFAWGSWTVSILNNADRFMLIDEVFSTLVNKHVEVTNRINETSAGYVKANYKETIKGSLQKGKLVVFKEKIGLKAWMQDDNLPLPSYIKEFMYQQ